MGGMPPAAMGMGGPAGGSPPPDQLLQAILAQSGEGPGDVDQGGGLPPELLMLLEKILGGAGAGGQAPMNLPPGLEGGGPLPGSGQVDPQMIAQLLGGGGQAPPQTPGGY